MQDIGNLNDLKKRLLRLNLEEINFDLKHSVDTKKYAYDPDSSLLAWIPCVSAAILIKMVFLSVPAVKALMTV